MPEPLSRKVILHNSVLFSDQICKRYLSEDCVSQTHIDCVPFEMEFERQDLIETDFLGILHQE